MTTGYQLPVSCPKCGGELLPIDQTRQAPDLSTATARCDYCLDVLTITVAICVTEPWPIDRTDPEARRAETAGAAALTLATTAVV